MASLSSAILCDFAQVRESVLFISSGALTRAFRDDLPGPMGMMLGVVVEIRYEEINLVHEIVVSVKEADTAEELGRFIGGVQVGQPELHPGESLYLPAPIDLRGVPVKTYGAHDVHVSVDGDLGAHLTFYITPPT